MHEAIMVGVGTALADDPLLTVRQNGVEQQAAARRARRRLRLPLGSRLVATAERLSDAGHRRRGRAGGRAQADSAGARRRSGACREARRTAGSTLRAALRLLARAA